MLSVKTDALFIVVHSIYLSSPHTVNLVTKRAVLIIDLYQVCNVTQRFLEAVQTEKSNRHKPKRQKITD